MLSAFDLKSVWDVGYAERGVVGGLIACCLIFPAAFFAPVLGCDAGYQPPRDQFGQQGVGGVSPSCETLAGKVTGESTSAIFDRAMLYELIGFGLAAALCVGLAYLDAREKTAREKAALNASRTMQTPPASSRESLAAMSDAPARAASAGAAPGPPPASPAAKLAPEPPKAKLKAVLDLPEPASASDSERWHDF